MDSRIPAQIEPLLHDFLSALATELPGYVTGFYLHGSIALNAFNEHLSDIDFIAFISRLSSERDLKALRTIHKQIAAKYPAWALEGSYLRWESLGQLEETIPPSPVHHDNKFEQAQKFDVNSVTWWVIKNHGIALIGPQPQELDLVVDWDVLVAKMKGNLNTYWAGFTKKPQHIAWLYSDYGVQWVVLGVLRQYYTFVARDITSKMGAGKYALSHMPCRWHRVIQEAIHIREQVPNSLYSSKLVRAIDAYLFLHHVIRVSNQLP